MTFGRLTLRLVGNSGRLALPVFAIAAALILSGCAGVGVRNTTLSFEKVVIDAGHGGRDSGAVRGGLVEKQTALDVATRLESKLRDQGFKTVMTRRDDRFVPLNTRAAISNRHRDAIFVSIHFNYSHNRRARGVETYYNHPYALVLAQRIQAELDRIAPGRFVRKARFRVLRLNRNPAVLVECGYLTNGHEARQVKKPDHREKIAEAIARGIVRTRGGAPAAGNAQRTAGPAAVAQ